MASLFMETTGISAEQTAGEVTYLLSQAGAAKIMQEFDKQRAVSGLSFSLRVGDCELAFTLPVRTEPIFKIINGRRPVVRRQRCEDQDREQSVRVAWRQIFRWVQAQLAMIETGMVRTEEVFMPYMVLKGKKTMYEVMSAQGFQKALPAPTND